MRTERQETIRLLRLATAVLLVVFVAAGPAFAQRGGGRGGQGPRGPGMGAGRGPMTHQGGRQQRHGQGFIQRLEELSPKEQERILANDERFQRLPAEQQQRIREHLGLWNSLSPGEKQQIRERREIFLSLSPAQRREARALFPRWHRLGAERRHELMKAFRRLRDLPPGKRTRFLSSSNVETRFSPEERELLAGLSQLLPDSQLAAGDGPEE